jgi:hypothetical protein
MKKISLILVYLVNMIIDRAGMILTCIWDTIVPPFTGSCASRFFLLSVTGYGNITEAMLANIRRWHGSIDDQFSCIDNLVNVIAQFSPSMTPPQYQELVDYKNRLQQLINFCRTTSASAVDRQERNSILKAAVGLSLLQIKMWAYGMYSAGQMTVDDIHKLGFLLPGEHSGHHARKEPTDILAEVKVKIVNEDFIRVVIDQSSGENAGPVLHGWPAGIKHALIVIVAVDGKTEIYRRMTTHLHNDIQMPEGSHGKQFIIKAAFLRHVDDEPKFGNEPTFSMPLTTEDLAADLDKEHHEEFEAQIQEIERHRLEIERLQKLINNKE